jgi:hypothetical protein
MKRRLGEILIEIGVLKDFELQNALALQKEEDMGVAASDTEGEK